MNTGNPKTFDMVVHICGNRKFISVSFDYSWKELAVMLQCKYGYEKDSPVFTFIYENQDFSLNCQEDYDEALKVVSEKGQMLHVEMRKANDSHEVGSQSLSQSFAEGTLSFQSDDGITRTSFASSSLEAHSKLCTECPPSIVSEVVADEYTELDLNLSPPCKPVDSQIDQVDSAVFPCSESGSGQQPSKDVLPNGISEEKDDVSYEVTKTTETITQTDSSSSQSNSSRESNRDLFLNNEIICKIKEEIRIALTKELSDLKEELTARISCDTELNNDLTKSVTATPPQTTKNTPVTKNEFNHVGQKFNQSKPLKKLVKQKSISDSGGEVIIETSVGNTSECCASFICENLIDGDSVVVGEQFVKYWVLKNEGTVAWGPHIELKLIKEEPVSQDKAADKSTPNQLNECHLKFGPDRTSVPLTTVEANGTTVIAVNHIAPWYPCTYSSFWMLSHDGHFFGPKICCRMEVVPGKKVISNSRSKLISTGSFDLSTDFSSTTDTWSPSHSSIDEGTSHIDPNQMVHSLAQDDSTVSENIPSEDLLIFTNVPLEHCMEENPHEDELGFQSIPVSFLDTDGEEKTSEIITLDNDQISLSLKEKEFEKEETSSSDVGKLTPKDLDQQEHEVNDDPSSICSDFEVVPLPDCFDTTKPLDGSDHSADEEVNSSSSILSTCTSKENEYILPTDNNETLDEEQAQVLGNKEEEEQDQSDESLTALVVEEREKSDDRSVDKGETSVVQTENTLSDVKEVEQNINEKSVPDTVRHTEPASSSSQEIAHSSTSQVGAPSGKLGSYEAGVEPNETLTESPVPQQRNIASSSGQPVRPWDAQSSIASSNASTPLEHGVQGLPDADEEENDQYTLAPETTHSITPTPPGHPTTSSSVSSQFHEPNHDIPEDFQRPNLESCLQSLVDMGFCDIELDTDLLVRYSYDLNRVVDELLRLRRKNVTTGSDGRMPDGSFQA